MATIDVKDANEATVAIEKPLAPGRAAASSSRPVALSNEDFAALAPNGTLTNRSGTITTGGTSQTLAAANAARKFLFVQNPSTQTESLFINFTSAASTTTNVSVEILPGDAFEMTAPGYVSTEAITVTAATTAHPFIAKEG